MRKRSTYRPRPLTPPMLVSRGLVNDEVELRERIIVESFSGGWAGEKEFDELTDMRNVLILAASYKDDKDALAMCAAMRITMGNIRDRYAKTKRMGASGEELKLLRAFLDCYRDFWMRQSVKLYTQACDELNKAHAMGLCKA